MCENFRTIPCALCKIQLIYFERVKIESHKKSNVGSILCFSEVILISFIIQNNKKNVIFNKKCMKFTVGQTFQTSWPLWHITSNGRSAPGVCLYLGPLWLSCGVFFSSGCHWVESNFLCFLAVWVYIWLFPRGDTLNKYGSLRGSLTFFPFPCLTTAESRANIWQ